MLLLAVRRLPLSPWARVRQQRSWLEPSCYYMVVGASRSRVVVILSTGALLLGRGAQQSDGLARAHDPRVNDRGRLLPRDLCQQWSPPCRAPCSVGGRRERAEAGAEGASSYYIIHDAATSSISFAGATAARNVCGAQQQQGVCDPCNHEFSDLLHCGCPYHANILTFRFAFPTSCFAAPFCSATPPRCVWHTLRSPSTW